MRKLLQLLLCFLACGWSAVIQVTAGGAINDPTYQFSDATGQHLANLTATSERVKASGDVETGNGNRVDDLAGRLATAETRIMWLEALLSSTLMQSRTFTSWTAYTGGCKDTNAAEPNHCSYNAMPGSGTDSTQQQYCAAMCLAIGSTCSGFQIKTTNSVCWAFITSDDTSVCSSFRGDFLGSSSQTAVNFVSTTSMLPVVQGDGNSQFQCFVRATVSA